MDAGFAIYLARHSMETALLLSAPILLTCMVVGVTVTLLQAVTSIRDMTLTIIPKLLSVGFVVLLLSGWMMEIIIEFTYEMFGYIQNISNM